MELSILIAKIAAVIYLSATIGAFSGKYDYKKIMDDMFSNAALAYISGFITVILGMLIVTYHNVWVKDWTVLVTLIGWIALFKGISIIAFPKMMKSMGGNILKSMGGAFPWITLVLGLVFAYFGFVA